MCKIETDNQDTNFWLTMRQMYTENAYQNKLGKIISLILITTLQVTYTFPYIFK